MSEIPYKGHKEGLEEGWTNRTRPIIANAKGYIAGDIFVDTQGRNAFHVAAAESNVMFISIVWEVASQLIMAHDNDEPFPNDFTDNELESQFLKEQRVWTVRQWLYKILAVQNSWNNFISVTQFMFLLAVHRAERRASPWCDW